MQDKIIIAVLFMACMLVFNADAQNNISVEFTGSWKGLMFDTAGHDFAVRLEIKDVKKGEEGSSIEYPDRECGGDLILEREYVDLNNNKVLEFREYLINGTEKCPADGFVRVSNTPQGVYQIKWIRKDFKATATGSLYKL